MSPTTACWWEVFWSEAPNVESIRGESCSHYSYQTKWCDLAALSSLHGRNAALITAIKIKCQRKTRRVWADGKVRVKQTMINAAKPAANCLSGVSDDWDGHQGGRKSTFLSSQINLRRWCDIRHFFSVTFTMLPASGSAVRQSNYETFRLRTVSKSQFSPRGKDGNSHEAIQNRKEHRPAYRTPHFCFCSDFCSDFAPKGQKRLKIEVKVHVNTQQQFCRQTLNLWLMINQKFVLSVCFGFQCVFSSLPSSKWAQWK